MRSRLHPLAPLALVLSAAGCIMPFNGPGGVRRDVQEATGREYDRTFALTIGRSGLALIRWAVHDEGDEPLPLEGLRKVELGVYKVRHCPGEVERQPVLAASSWPGWRPVVEMHGEEGENVLVLAEAGGGGSTERLLLVVENQEELIVVRLSGSLDEFIEQAMRYALEQADRRELIDPSIEEYRRKERSETPGL